MSQVQPTEIQTEFLEVLTVTPAHNALVYLVKKHGPTHFPEDLNTVLSYLGMLNSNVAWENVPLFAKMVRVTVNDIPAVEAWFSENHIYSSIVNNHLRVNKLQQEVNSVLFPQTELKLG